MARSWPQARHEARESLECSSRQQADVAMNPEIKALASCLHGTTVRERERERERRRRRPLPHPKKANTDSLSQDISLPLSLFSGQSARVSTHEHRTHTLAVCSQRQVVAPDHVLDFACHDHCLLHSSSLSPSMIAPCLSYTNNMCISLFSMFHCAYLCMRRIYTNCPLHHRLWH